MKSDPFAKPDISVFKFEILCIYKAFCRKVQYTAFAVGYIMGRDIFIGGQTENVPVLKITGNQLICILV